MPRRPLVTVLMSVYNDARFLRESVNSILAQLNLPAAKGGGIFSKLLRVEKSKK